jgi:amino acid permease
MDQPDVNIQSVDIADRSSSMIYGDESEYSACTVSIIAICLVVILCVIFMIYKAKKRSNIYKLIPDPVA